MGRVVLGRVLFGPSCLEPGEIACHWVCNVFYLGEQDSSLTRQFLNMIFGDSSNTDLDSSLTLLKAAHQHFYSVK